MTPASQLSAGLPLRFPNCPKCPYLQGGSSSICFGCASKSFEPIAKEACQVCSQFLKGDGSCPNWLCTDSTRRIERIDAIAYLSGTLRGKIHAYKYENRTGWASIFGRVLLGWLEDNLWYNMPGLILANPTWVEPDSRFLIGHTERVLDAAKREDTIDWWNIDVTTPRALIKTSATDKSAANTASAKRKAAKQLRSALNIPDVRRVEGKRILVYDDVCTTGSQLNAVAGCLLDDGGAAQVRAVVLARAPWRP